MNSGIALLTLGLALAVATGYGDEPAAKLVPRPLPGFQALSTINSARSQSAAEAESILQAALDNKPLPPPTDAAMLPTSSSEETPESLAEKAAAAEKAKTALSAPVAAQAETNSRARIVYIHRRATLPPEFTADLAKPEDPKAGRPSTAAAPANQARPGKIRIIPKAEVATLLAPPAESKPTTP